jgi:hypothetical protein
MTRLDISGPVPGILGAYYRVAELPAALPDAILINPWTEVGGGKVLMRIPGVARYLIEGGADIAIDPEDTADFESVRHFLHGPARGYLIHQRGEVPLEAATVVSPGGSAVAISSTSGLGKSTLAAALCARGWKLVADGITRITLTAGRVLCWSSDDDADLWRNACISFGIDADALKQVRRGLEKYHAPMPAHRGPSPLRAVVRLVRGESVARMDALAREQIARSLQQWQFRWQQIAPLLPADEVNQAIIRIADICPVWNLSGAKEVSPFELADLVARSVP